ncbi:MAG: hypothetical protein ABJB74_08750 [Gemmatimonas sp.]
MADSIVEFVAWPNLQAERLQDGRVLVAPLPSNTVVALVDKELNRSTLFMRSGHGPREAQSFPGAVIVASGSGIRALVSSRDPSRVTVFNSAGGIESEAPSIVRPDGIGFCDGAVYMSGVDVFGDNFAPGIFKVTRGLPAEMIFPLREGNSERPSLNLVQEVHVNNGKVLVGRPNSPTVAISRRSCDDFHNVAVKLPWFVPWERALNIRSTEAPIQSVVRNVRWFDETSALLLILRAKPGSVYPKGAVSQGPPARVPSRKAPPTEAEIHIETVLVLFDVTTGAVLDQLILPRQGWSFLSNRELIRHSFDPDEARYEVFAIDLRP